MKIWQKTIGILLLATVLLMFSNTKLHAAKLFEKSYVDDPMQYAKVYRYKKNENMQIALTFDDGPHPVYTDRILDILKKYNVKATFFMIGENVCNYTETALRVKNEGHEIGNHTTKHLSANRASDKELIADVMSCSNVIFDKLGYKTTLIRPPEGAIADSVLRTCRSLECSVILWNVDTRDWAHASPQNIYNNVIANTDPGDIILMHDYIGKSSPTPEALELIIPKLLSDGYNFVTVSELIKADG